jgi:signal peptidase I
MENSLKKGLKRVWKGWGCSVFVALIIASSFKSAIADWYVIPTGSMKPTIVEGDRIFVNKLAYDLKIPYTTWHITEWGTPQRGEIVVFYSPVDGKRLIKRVIGIPGDSIEMRDNQLIINGAMVKYEPFDHLKRKNPALIRYSDKNVFIESLSETQHPVRFSAQSPSLRSFGPVTVPKGQYFMMGDNRDNSADSRYFGFVGRDRVVGQATSIVLSLDIKNNYLPRWDRFFSTLP